MGYVIKTESVGGTMVSHAFENYEDFEKFSKKDVHISPVKFSEEVTSDYTLTLDEHEVYTLRLLLGHCFDDECSSINAKLDEMFDEDLDCDDYNRLYFQYVNEDGDVEELHDGDKEVTIKFKN